MTFLERVNRQAPAVVAGMIMLCGSLAAQDPAGAREIPVVRSAAPAWGGAARWSVAARPSVVIGEAMGEVELHAVTAARRLPDGRIVVANDGSRQVLAFSASGEPLWEAGREGQGPREFGRVLDLVVRDGVIVVWDSRNGRLTRVSADGEILGTTRFDQPPDAPISYHRLAGFLTDSTVLLHRWAWGIPAPGPAGPVFEASPNLVYGTDGRLLDSLGVYGVEQYRSPEGLGPTLLWHRRTRVAVDDGRLYTGDGSRWEIEVHRRGASPERVLRLDREREPVSRDAREAFIEREIARIPPDFPEQARTEGIARLRAAVVPERKPAYGALVVDRLGYLWIQEYRHLREYAMPGPRRWTVLDPSGRWLGDTVLPDMEVHEIGEDWILGWRVDELGVERVVLHALDRNR